MSQKKSLRVLWRWYHHLWDIKWLNTYSLSWYRSYLCSWMQGMKPSRLLWWTLRSFNFKLRNTLLNRDKSQPMFISLHSESVKYWFGITPKKRGLYVRSHKDRCLERLLSSTRPREQLPLNLKITSALLEASMRSFSTNLLKISQKLSRKWLIKPDYNMMITGRNFKYKH